MSVVYYDESYEECLSAQTKSNEVFMAENIKLNWEYLNPLFLMMGYQIGIEDDKVSIVKPNKSIVMNGNPDYLNLRAFVKNGSRNNEVNLTYFDSGEGHFPYREIDGAYVMGLEKAKTFCCRKINHPVTFDWYKSILSTSLVFNKERVPVLGKIVLTNPDLGLGVHQAETIVFENGFNRWKVSRYGNKNFARHPDYSSGHSVLYGSGDDCRLITVRDGRTKNYKLETSVDYKDCDPKNNEFHISLQEGGVQNTLGGITFVKAKYPEVLNMFSELGFFEPKTEIKRM